MRSNKFTMIELIAVITIMSLLLGVTIGAMRTDSTATNAVILGDTLTYAKTQAMASLSSGEVIEVTVAADSITVDIVDTLTLERDNIKEESLLHSSEVVDGTGVYKFNHKGVPDTNGLITFVIKSGKDDAEAIVRLRPFTGKVVYY